MKSLVAIKNWYFTLLLLAVLLCQLPVTRAADEVGLGATFTRETVATAPAEVDGANVAYLVVAGGTANSANSNLPVAADEGLWRRSKGLPIGDRIRLHVSAGKLPADGHSTLPLVLTLLDAQGHAVTSVTRVRLQISLGRLRAPNGKEAASFDLAIKGGVAHLTLLAPVTPGEALLQASSGAVRVRGKIRFVPEMRPLIAIGIIESGVSTQRVTADPNAPALASLGFEDSLHHWGNDPLSGTAWGIEGRAAGFVKGTIADNLLLTGAFDSNKINPQRFFSDVDPNQYFPISGDASIVNYDARSTGKLYLRLDRDQNHLLYGDFQTVAPGDKSWLGTYARTLTGLSTHVETSDKRLDVFAAMQSTHQFVDEQPGRGISGPYAVSQPNAVANSEEVDLLVRDRNQPAIVLSRQQLSRYVDYDFEPFSGRILFRQPVPSVDENLNPVSIRITYEVDNGGPKYLVAGLSADFDLTPYVTFGVRSAEDRDPLTPFKLYGADTVWRLGEHTTLTLDAAHSQGNQLFATAASGALTPVSTVTGLTSLDPSGSAARLELVHHDDQLDARVYTGKADLTFENANADLSPGRTESGLHATYHLNDSTQLVTDALHSVDVTTDAHRTGATLGVESKIWTGGKLETGLSYVNQSYNSALPAVAQYAVGAVPGTASGAPINNTGFGFGGGGLLASPLGAPLALPSAGAPSLVEQDYLAAQVKLTQKINDQASAYAQYEHTVDGTSGALAAVGGEYRLSDSNRFYARYESIDSLTGVYGLGDGSRATQAVAGFDTSYMHDGTVYDELRLAGTQSGQSAADALGVRNLWHIAPGLNATTSVERQEVLNPSVLPNATANALIGTQSATALAAGLEYIGSPLWKTSERLEYRFSDVQTNWLSTFALTRKLSDDWSFLGRNVYMDANSHSSGSPASILNQDRAQLGFAYRNVASNEWNLLARYEYQTNYNNDPVVGSDNRTQIVSAVANYHPVRSWEYEAQLAAKHVSEVLSGTDSNYQAALVAGRITWDFTPHWDIGILASSTSGGGTVDRGVALEVGRRIYDNLWVSVGGIAGRYADSELFSSNSSWRGVYARIRFKFDEKTFRIGDPSVDRSLPAAAATNAAPIANTTVASTSSSASADSTVEPTAVAGGVATADALAVIGATASADSNAKLAVSVPSLPGRPLGSRVGEPAEITALQARLDNLGHDGDCDRVYQSNKAQAWLNFARYAAQSNIQTEDQTAALSDARAIIEGLESHSTLTMQTAELPHSVHLRDDLWRASAAAKAGGSMCAAPKMSAFCDVQLAWVDYEASAGGWRHVEPYVRIAEDYCAAGKAPVTPPSAPQAAPVEATAAASAPANSAPAPLPGPVRAAAPEDVTTPAQSTIAALRGLAMTPTPSNEKSVTVLFPHDRSRRHDIRTPGHAQLARFAAYLKQLPAGTRLVVTGHADITGSRKYNRALSARRARSVVAELKSLGVDPRLIRIVAAGSEQPIRSCRKPAAGGKQHYFACLEPNRRVVVTIVHDPPLTAHH